MKYLLFIILLLTSCTREKPQCIDPWATTGVNADTFLVQHHYWKNFNFLTTDTLALESHIPGEVVTVYSRDSVVLDAGDEIVVANIAMVPSDSIDSVWVMVARDQVTMGWVRESELLDRSVPDNPTSRFIAGFSDSRTLVVIALLSLAFAFFLIQHFRRQRFFIVHFNDVKSFYPTLLCLTMSLSAALYGTLQQHYVEVWREFYFHPSLNPFGQPNMLMLFLFSVWAIIIVIIAVVDDLRKLPDAVDAAAYLASLAGVCIILYLTFSLSVRWPAGYVALVLYWIFAIFRHCTHNHARYICGNCGAALRAPGTCPHCGAINE